MVVSGLKQRVERLELLYRVGMALSAEKDRDRLVEMILLEAKTLCNADGGTLYLRTADDELGFIIMRTDSLEISLGGTTGRPINYPAIPLYDKETGAPNQKNVATAAALLKRSVNIQDAYHAQGFDFTGTKKFDAQNNYRSTSFLTIPMLNNDDDVIGVLQLLNAKDPDSGETIPFGDDEQRIVEALASQAAVALENQQLIEGQKRLLESFIKLIAAAIDAKSPYTGGHCERVPVLTEMLAKAACESSEGSLRDFSLNDEEWYELRIAAWLHDCGKVVTPVHVMDKATKLETIADRMPLLEARFDVLIREAENHCLRSILNDPSSETEAREGFEARKTTLLEELEFLQQVNVGGEYLPPEKQERIRKIGSRPYPSALGGPEGTLLTDDEIHNLTVSKGTLTHQERLIINNHMVQTIKMLNALPFPKHLKRVPEYAGGHHEKMDGSGYPKGIYAGDMSVPARLMAIADVFEALTAQDRPYKKGKTLSESMRIMGFMKKDNHLDPELFDLFVSSGVYREYARLYLPDELVDDVDEASLIAIEPKVFEMPDDSLRAQRWHDFLPEYLDEG